MGAPPASAMGKPPGTDGAASPWRRLDDGVYRVERFLVVTTLTVMVGLVSVDVLHRRLTSPDSKVGRLLRAILSPFWDPSPDTVRIVDGPVSTGIVVALVLVFSVLAVRTVRGDRSLGRAVEIGLGALVAALVVGLAWLVLVVPSGVHLAILLGIATMGFVVGRARSGVATWRRDATLAVLVGVAGAAFLVWIVPEGFTWSKEASMVLLVWNGFLGASMCSHDGRHVEFDFGPRALPDGIRGFFVGGGSVLLVVFLAALVFIGVVYVFAPETGLVARGGRFEMTGLPDWIVGASIPVVFGIMMLRAGGRAVRLLRDARFWRPLVVAVLAVAVVWGAFALSGALATGATAGGWGALALVALIVVLLIVGEPLYMILGAATIASFVLWEEGYGSLADFTGIAERIRGLADTQAFLAIPFFMLSGAIMATGQMSDRIIGFAKALLGWMPGGLAVAGVGACVIFAAISGSSPATLAAMGPVIAPALIAQGYRERFGIGLVTTAGSLGILVPPSIPMIIYTIFHTASPIEVERLFLAGFGPGFLMAAVLCLYSSAVAVRRRIELVPFSLSALAEATRKGFWALGLPALVLGGIYTGVFNAIEAAAASCVYAIVVEVYFHRGFRWRDLPKVFAETSSLLGSFVVIVVMAMSLAEFLEVTGVPARATAWIEGMDLARWQFLLALNVMLILVGCLVDIMSAIMILVPIVAPMALALGIDPLHLAIVFIVNLEIGYLTPPVGLNLFLGATMFKKTFGYMLKATFPFVSAMLIGLLLVTYVPEVTLTVVDWVYGSPETEEEEAQAAPETEARVSADAGPGEVAPTGRVLSMEEMMRLADQARAAEEDAGPGDGGR